MEGNKVTTYAVVALVVGILVGAGVGYAVFHDDNNNTDEKYWFYLNFGEDDRTKWYSITGTGINNSTVAFDKLMSMKGWEYEVSSLGYIASIDGVSGDGGWAIFQYLYADTTSAAATGSIANPIITTFEWGGKTYSTNYGSNGWHLVAGYGDAGNKELKLNQIGTNIFYMSLYLKDDQGNYVYDTPADDPDWMTIGPFKA